MTRGEFTDRLTAAQGYFWSIVQIQASISSSPGAPSASGWPSAGRLDHESELSALRRRLLQPLIYWSNSQSLVSLRQLAPDGDSPITEYGRHVLDCLPDAMRCLEKNDRPALIAKPLQPLFSGFCPRRRKADEHETHRPRCLMPRPPRQRRWRRESAPHGSSSHEPPHESRRRDPRSPACLRPTRARSTRRPAAVRPDRAFAHARCVRAGSWSAWRWSSVEGGGPCGGYLPPRSTATSRRTRIARSVTSSRLPIGVATT